MSVDSSITTHRARGARAVAPLFAAILGASCAVVGTVPLCASDAEAATDAAAADATADDLNRRIADLERQIAALRDEVARKGSGGADPELEKKLEALSREIERLRLGAAAPSEAKESVGGFGPAASKVYTSRPGVSVGGYGEVLYVDPSGTSDDGADSEGEPGADLLRAVLYFGYKFNDRLIFNSEIELEHAIAADGEPGEVAAEFAYVDFRWRPALGVRGGLLLVPVGFLNELHEPPIFLGAQRPEVERFIIPTTWRELGGGVYGEAGPVSWKAYLVTSLDAEGFTPDSGIRGGRQKGAEANATDLAVTARIDWVPVQGLLLGASGFTGDTAQGNPDLDGARLTQWDAHAEWRAHGIHMRALFVRTSLDEAAAVSASLTPPMDIGSQMNGYYVEAGYNVLARWRNGGQELMPFMRYEALDTQAEVASGSTSDPANDRTVRTYGFRWRPIPNVAIKADWQDLGDAADTGVDRFNLALGWMF